MLAGILLFPAMSAAEVGATACIQNAGASGSGKLTINLTGLDQFTVYDVTSVTLSGSTAPINIQVNGKNTLVFTTLVFKDIPQIPGVGVGSKIKITYKKGNPPNQSEHTTEEITVTACP